MDDDRGAILAIWNDVVPGAGQEFEAWHVREHMPERLALPGWTRGRRYVAVDGHPAFFNFYEVSSAAALLSPEYRARLNDPTSWTRSVVSQFRNTIRTLCNVVHDVGRGSGGAIETVRLRAPSDEARFVEALADGLLERWCALPGITTIRLLERHGTAASSGGTAETALRGGPDREADWIILVEGTRPEALSEARASAGSDRVLDEAFGSGERERGLYRLQYDLSRSNEEV